MKKELKGFICGVVTTSVLLCGGAFAAGRWTTIDVLQDDITVIVDGEKVTESNFVYNDRTYLPLRAVAEAVNKPVEYDETTNTAYIGNRTDNVIVDLDTSTITYYQNVGWCPNFGAFTNIECASISPPDENDGLYMYIYEKNDKTSIYISEYIKLIESLGFKHSQTTDDNIKIYTQGSQVIMIKEISNQAAIVAGNKFFESGGGDDIGVYIHKDAEGNEYVSISSIEFFNQINGYYTSILVKKDGTWDFSEYTGNAGFKTIATGTPIYDNLKDYYIPIDEYKEKIKPILSKYKYKSILP